MTDTRAGFWLLFTTAALTVAVRRRCSRSSARRRTTRCATSSGSRSPPASVLLPIVGILLVSSEWSQRTAVMTFALVPQRSRVLWAKLAAGVALSVAALQIGLAVALVGTRRSAATWSLPAWMVGQSAISLATGMVTGIAFGAVLLASAPAIVLYFALPLAWGALGTLPFLEGAARWLDGGQSLVPLTEELMSTTQWARAGATLAVWMLLPLLAGFWRVTRGDVR